MHSLVASSMLEILYLTQSKGGTLLDGLGNDPWFSERFFFYQAIPFLNSRE